MAGPCMTPYSIHHIGEHHNMSNIITTKEFAISKEIVATETENKETRLGNIGE